MKGVVISVAHQKGGVGKSTVAFNLAIMLEANVIDLDSEGESMTEFNLRRKEAGLKELNVIKFDNVEALKNFLEKYNKDKPLLIDCAGYNSFFTKIVLSLSDLIITPVSDERAELAGLKKFQKILEKINNITERPLNCFVLLNKINPRIKLFSELETFIKNRGVFSLFKTKIRRRVDLSNSAPAGYSVIEYNPGSLSANEFKELVKEIRNIIST